jgi:hypothetical protein
MQFCGSLLHVWGERRAKRRRRRRIRQIYIASGRQVCSNNERREDTDTEDSGRLSVSK